MHPRKRRRTTSRLLAGGAAVIGAGALLALPVRALAQEDEGASWVDEALSGLLEDGTLTQAQVDAVEQALRDARPERGPGGHGPFGRGFVFGFGLHAGLAEAAEAIGIEESALMDALRDGQTLAEVAEANGVEPEAVIDALIAAAEAAIDEAVADGRIDEAEAEERRAELSERITQFVNEGFPGPRLERRLGDEDTPTTEDEDTTVTTPEAPTTTEGGS